MSEVEVTSKGWSITLTDNVSGRQAVVRLYVEDGKFERWVVKGENYQGHFDCLERAYEEAIRHLRYKGKINGE